MDELDKLIDELEDFGWSPPHAEYKAICVLKAVRSWNRWSPPKMSGEIRIKYPTLVQAICRALQDAERDK